MQGQIGPGDSAAVDGGSGDGNGGGGSGKGQAESSSKKKAKKNPCARCEKLMSLLKRYKENIGPLHEKAKKAHAFEVRTLHALLWLCP